MRKYRVKDRERERIRRVEYWEGSWRDRYSTVAKRYRMERGMYIRQIHVCLNLSLNYPN